MGSIELQRVSLHGQDVAYRAAGEGPVLLLLHGMAGSSRTWRFVMPKLAERFTVVAPDMLGHGETAKPKGDYSLGSFASSVRDLLVALGHERATMVGQSFGGGVAMQFAYQFPDRCERLVLVSSGGLGQEVNALLRLLTLPGADLVLPVACTDWLHDAGVAVANVLGRLGFPAGRQLSETWESYHSLADAETRTAFLQTLRAVIDHNGQRICAHDRLYLASEVPTMIVWGDHDPIIPVHQAFVTHDEIAGSRLEIFEGVGHYPHCEEPERFLRVLTGFVDSTEPAAVAEPRWQELLREGMS
ncbi:MAG: alpha/beta fold hydrolase [Acidimicrobiia bacterium]